MKKLYVFEWRKIPAQGAHKGNTLGSETHEFANDEEAIAYARQYRAHYIWCVERNSNPREVFKQNVRLTDDFSLTDWGIFVEAMCTGLQHDGYVVPPENNKNTYLRACWLLSRYNLLDPHMSIILEHDRINLMKVLPKLKALES